MSNKTSIQAYELTYSGFSIIDFKKLIKLYCHSFASKKQALIKMELSIFKPKIIGGLGCHSKITFKQQK